MEIKAPTGLGAILALLVLILVVVFAAIGKSIGGLELDLFLAALALSRLC